MFKTDHRLNAVGQQFIEQLIVVRRIVFIDRDVFIIGEKARPVNRRAVVGQPRQLHQLHVFAEAVDKIGRHRRAVAVMPDAAVVLVPEIRPGILARFLTAPALGLPRGSGGAEDKVAGDRHLYCRHCVLISVGWPGRSLPGAERFPRGGRLF